MRHFGMEPSFARFWSLNNIRSSTAPKGFFYIAPKPNLRLLHRFPKTSPWKDKFIYIKSPENRPCRVPTCWKVTRNRSLTISSPYWDKDFISNQLTVALYDASKILKEEVLTLADLSPAPIETTRSLEMAVRASMVAKAMKEQRDVLLAQSQPADKEEKNESPPVTSSKEKDYREQDSFGCGFASKRTRTEKCLPEEVRTAEWVLKTEKIVRDMRTDASSLSRDDDIGFPSSVLKSSCCDEDILEMYRRTLRHDDQLALAHLPLVKLEDFAAYHSLATNAFIHHLLLRAAYSENDLLSCKKKLNNANQKSEAQKLEQLKKSLNDSNLMNTKLRQRLEESSRKREESFNAGRAVGCEEFIESDEYHAAMKNTREETLRSFLKSNTYATLVAKRAAVYEFKGFSKCRTQAKKLGAFRMGFDSDNLNPFKDENFEEPFIEDEIDAEEEDEFAYLLELPPDGTNSRNPGH